MRIRKELTPAEREKIKQKQALLDTQEVAANLVVDGLAKDSEILDLKELVANLIITTGGAA